MKLNDSWSGEVNKTAEELRDDEIYENDDRKVLTDKVATEVANVVILAATENVAYEHTEANHIKHQQQEISTEVCIF